MNIDQPLPSSPESERAILGSILLDSSLIAEARRLLSPDAFYVSSYRTIYSAMLQLEKEDRLINPIVLGELLRDQGLYEQIGGGAAISAVSHGLPHVKSIRDYAEIVKQASRRRWIVKLAGKVEGMAIDGDESEDQILAFVASQVDTARDRWPDGKHKPKSLTELAGDSVKRYDLFLRGISTAVPTGFYEIDAHMLGGGLVPSLLYILAARPSMGKTSLALDIAANIGSTGKRVYVLSREMPRESIYDRLIAVESGVDRWKIRPQIWERDYHKLIEAQSRMSELPIILDDGSKSISDVRGYLREYARKGQRIDCFMVDYLQLVESESSRRESRNQEVGSISRDLKGLAMEFQIPVIALSQLSRANEKQSREPELSDLRDSGELEQDADAVFFLFGDKPEEKASYFSRTLKCAKQRDGALFRCEMPFDGPLVTFRKLEKIENVQTTNEEFLG